MLPVLGYDGWQVEAVIVDLGDGLREWIELRHGDERCYVTTASERDVVLREHSVDPASLVEVGTIEDGCE
jgi:hypothetical protein